MNLSLSVRADLFRAALHFVAKGQEAKDTPELAGVRVERSAAGGVIVIAMSDAGLIALRDPDGVASSDETVLLGTSFFDAARRAQREANIAPVDSALARLEIENEYASLNPGASLQWVAISPLPYPDWRKAVPNKAAHARPAPAITPAALECLHGAAAILSRAAPPSLTGLFIAAADDSPDAVASFDAWPLGFAVLETIHMEARAMPWRAPIWMITETPVEARAS